MAIMLALMLAVADEATKRDDAIKTMVVTLLASYLGIAIFTALLFEGVKLAVPAAVVKRENLFVLFLTFAVGGVAKWLIPVYGETDKRAWAMHMVVLVVVAIIGMMFHDKLMDAVKAILKKVVPGVGNGGEPPGGGPLPGGGAQ